jgi:hypothetical protein
VPALVEPIDAPILIQLKARLMSASA